MKKIIALLVLSLFAVPAFGATSRTDTYTSNYVNYWTGTTQYMSITNQGDIIPGKNEWSDIGESTHAFKSLYVNQIYSKTGIVNTQEIFTNLPATTSVNWGQVTSPGYGTAGSSGATVFASHFPALPLYGQTLMIGTTFNAYDHWLTTSITNGYVIVKGTDSRGNVAVDSITFQVGACTLGSVPFVSISSFSVYYTSTSNITPNVVRVVVGYSGTLGLANYIYNIRTGVNVIEADTRITSGTFNANYGTYRPLIFPDGARDYSVTYPAQQRAPK